MPIHLPRGLPAITQLRAEGLRVSERSASETGKDGKLRLLLINLMPDKVATETQIARLLAATPYSVDLSLALPASAKPKSAAPAHVAAFYRRWPDIKHEAFDGLIITGAPVERIPFEDVVYWQELTEIFDWAAKHVRQAYYICWAAQAALYHFHGVPKHDLAAKRFGLFDHEILSRASNLFHGFGDGFHLPVSRHSEVRAADLPAASEVVVHASSKQAGLGLVEDTAKGMLCNFNHFEYDHDTLAREYHRDRQQGQAIDLPRNYFPEDDSERCPMNSWRPFGQLLILNWLQRLARARALGSEAQAAMEWLLAPESDQDRKRRGQDEILLFGIDSLDSVPALLAELARHQKQPTGFRVHRNGDATALIDLRLDPLPDTLVERLCQRLLALPGMRRVAYRGQGKSGRIFAVQKPKPVTQMTGHRGWRPAPLSWQSFGQGLEPRRVMAAQASPCL